MTVDLDYHKRKWKLKGIQNIALPNFGILLSHYSILLAQKSFQIRLTKPSDRPHAWNKKLFNFCGLTRSITQTLVFLRSKRA